MHPTERFAVLGAITALLLSAVFATRFHLNVLVAWAIAVNLTTILMFGYDKAIAGTGHTRVPEKVLLAFVLVGGTAGALLAMPLFRHKTSKASFRYRFWAVVFLQLLVVVSYLLWYK